MALQLCSHSGASSGLRLAAQRSLQQTGSRPIAAGARRRPLRCAAQARPFGAGDAGRQPQPPAALARQAPAADTAAPAPVTIQPAPPVGEQARQLRALVQRLAGAASYGGKVRAGNEGLPDCLVGASFSQAVSHRGVASHQRARPTPPPLPACSWRSCWPSQRCRPSLPAHGAHPTAACCWPEGLLAFTPCMPARPVQFSFALMPACLPVCPPAGRGGWRRGSCRTLPPGRLTAWPSCPPCTSSMCWR